MKKIIFVLGLFFGLFSFSSYSQTKTVDLKKIEVIAKTETYAKLLERYQSNDTTLTTDDYNILYFGQAFQSDYAPYEKQKLQDELWNYLRKSPDSIDYKKVLNYTSSILEDTPFNILVLMIASDAYKTLNDANSARLYNFKIRSILTTIISSGDGLKPKSAYIVTNIHDEYAALGVLGLRATRQALTKNGDNYFDLMTIAKNGKKIKKIYFDINLFYGK